MKKRIPAAVMILGMLFGLFGCSGAADQTVSSKTIASVEMMTLTLRGMRGGTVYKFETQSAPPKLCRYREKYSGTEDFLELEKSITLPHEEMIGLMNACKVFKWDGFHGKHPKNVSDGIMFCFEAEINGGQTIRADGSANFPKGYHEFVRTLDEMLAKGEAD